MTPALQPAVEFLMMISGFTCLAALVFGGTRMLARRALRRRRDTGILGWMLMLHPDLYRLWPEDVQPRKRERRPAGRRSFAGI